MPSNIFEALAEGFYKPKLNAVGVDGQGNLVDANGKPTSLYTQPGFLERSLNPDADRVRDMNLEASSLPEDQRQQLALQQSRAGKLFGSLDSNIQSQFPGGSSEWYSETGGAPTGTPRQFIAEQNEAAARAAGAENTARNATTAGLLGTPESSAWTENMGQTHEQNLLGGYIARDPSLNYDEGLKLRNDINQNSTITPVEQGNTLQSDLWRKEAIPYEGSGELSTAMTQAGLAGTRAGDLGYLQGTEDTGIKRAAALAPFGGEATPMSPYAVRTDPASGMTDVGQNPLSIMSKMTGQPSSMTSVGGGLHVPVPSGVMPVMGGGQWGSQQGQTPQLTSSTTHPGYLYDGTDPSKVYYKNESGQLESVTDPKFIAKMQQEDNSKKSMAKKASEEGSTKPLPTGTASVLGNTAMGTLKSLNNNPYQMPGQVAGEAARQKLISIWNWLGGNTN